MDVNDYFAAVRLETTRFIAAAAIAPLDARVPTCPEWTVRDLLGHVVLLERGIVWYLRTGHSGPPSEVDVQTWESAPPRDGQVLDWVRADLLATYDALAGAAPDVRCWTFLPAASPLAFWARRHAHETAVHRVDLQLAAGAEVCPVDPAFAADGIEELLAYFARSGGPLEGKGRMEIRASDTGAAWTVALPVDGHCVLSGPVDRLYLELWNRGAGEVTVTGDQWVLQSWRHTARWTFG